MRERDKEGERERKSARPRERLSEKEKGQQDGYLPLFRRSI